MLLRTTKSTVNNTQNVGSTGMITSDNGANPDKGSTYEDLGKFGNIYLNHLQLVF